MDKNLTAIIADDESPARERMKRMLEENGGISVVGVGKNGLEALQLIADKKPDIAFLDIQMPGLTGIEVVENLPDDCTTSIVFTTAHNEHAIRAFELNAVDYLLKPFSEERLQSALQKLEKQKVKTPLGSAFEKVADDLKEAGVQLSTKIPVPTKDRYKLVDYNEIYFLELENRQTTLATKDEKFSLNRTIDYFEKKLPDADFLRINRSTIISLSKIKEIVIWFGNRYKIVLHNGKDFICSREKSKIIKGIVKSL